MNNPLYFHLIVGCQYRENNLFLHEGVKIISQNTKCHINPSLSDLHLLNCFPILQGYITFNGTRSESKGHSQKKENGMHWYTVSSQEQPLLHWTEWKNKVEGERRKMGEKDFTCVCPGLHVCS